jgi:hypothetical protein
VLFWHFVFLLSTFGKFWVLAMMFFSGSLRFFWVSFWGCLRYFWVVMATHLCLFVVVFGTFRMFELVLGD